MREFSKKQFWCILILFIIAAIPSCSEQNDLKGAKAGSSESDVDTSGEDSGEDSGGSGSTPGVFVISAITGSTTEAGGTATFTVKLNSQPTANVSTALSSSDTTEGTVSPSSLTFTSANWSTAQTVTVTGVDDTAVDGNQGYTIVLGVSSSSDSNYSGLDPADVSVSNTDDDAAGITINSNGDNTTESGDSFTFTAKLNSQPSSDVTIAISSSDTSEGSASQSSLTFTSSNWGTEQYVLISGVDDSLDDGNQNYTVIIGAATSSDSNYYGTDPDDLSVTNIDDDTAGFTVTTISGVTTEYGTTATFTVKLSSEPTANVTIAVSSSDTGEGTVSPSTLTFTSSNWSTAQTVTATGVNDGSADGNQNYNIVLGAATSIDSNFSSINPADVAVTNTDDDTAGFTISSITDNTTELGDNATFTVLLNSQPSANVTIGVSSSDTGEGTVSPSSLTFTNSNWSTAQTVTVTGVDDNETDGNQNYSVVLAAASSSDSDYNNNNPSDISLSNLDDEWGGAKQTGSSDKEDMGLKIINDSLGNGYILGNTYGNFDGLSNPNNGIPDFFILKYSLNGSILWKKQFGISGAQEEVGGIGIDSNNNIYVSGYAMLGLNGVSANVADLFIFKMNSSGEIQWTQLLGGNQHEKSNDIAVDASGNVFATGYTTGDLDGNTNLGDTTYQGDIFLTKYNTNGVKQWTKQFGTNKNDYGYTLDLDSSGNIYVGAIVGGSYDGNTSTGRPDTVLIKFNSNGIKQWSKQHGNGSYSTDINDVAVDSSGYVYMLGQANWSFDGNTSAGGDDYFLIKYNSSGTKQWSKLFGSDQDDSGMRMDFDSSDNIYITGWTKGNLDGNTNSGDYDLFITKMNSSGTIQWTKLHGTTLLDIGQGIDVDSKNKIFVTGFTRNGNIDHSIGNDLLYLKYNSSGDKQ